MKRLVCAVLTVMLIMACFTSCETIGGSARELMRAPKATGDMGEIQRALYDYAGNAVSIKHPVNGTNRSAFLLADLNGDKQDEAVAFYSTTNADGVDAIHVNLISKTKDGWKSVYDVETVGSSIDKVEVADISSTGTISLLVGVEAYSATSKQLNLFTYDGKKMTQHVQETYTDFCVYDLMGTGSKQLMIFSLNLTDRSSVVKMLTFNGEVVEQRGSVVTDGNISGYAQIVAGKLSNGTPALYIDSYKSAVSMVTDVVYYLNGALTNPFFDTTISETQLTLRNSTKLSTDINDDGVLDIPFTDIYPGYADKTDSDRQYVFTWKTFDGAKFTDVIKGDFYYDGGYRLKFPEAWVNNITLVTDSTSKMRSYRVWDPEAQTSTDEILRIRVYDIDAFAKLNTDDMIELARSETTVWAARIVMSEGEYAIDETTLKELFELI